ncbi:hypothetical protein BU24DRAFT_421286 [Aaosphaeria arxii CBS 175.79]|uniref:Uncharacterized protein n=1 Tax=Aaosphaeria arxii CBS 175.79 TaxID=1450172 RepID=A0A6A5XYC4_9PLEO|nr:uncharacterized protein BU24DRAFT_421286 [Aaosphaeria arxii CBS 175.79]KAF2018308.1 hypothetical protein BU24DRAFT_421286 [Aaosphaeria arxii CBS 175.79]
MREHPVPRRMPGPNQVPPNYRPHRGHPMPRRAAQPDGRQGLEVDMRRPDRRGPDRRVHDMRGPDMLGPDMRGPDMRGPDMRRPDMRGPHIRRPDMLGPSVQRDSFSDRINSRSGSVTPLPVASGSIPRSNITMGQNPGRMIDLARGANQQASRQWSVPPDGNLRRPHLPGAVRNAPTGLSGNALEGRPSGDSSRSMDGTIHRGPNHFQSTALHGIPELATPSASRGQGMLHPAQAIVAARRTSLAIESRDMLSSPVQGGVVPGARPSDQDVQQRINTTEAVNPAGNSLLMPPATRNGGAQDALRLEQSQDTARVEQSSPLNEDTVTPDRAGSVPSTTTGDTPHTHSDGASRVPVPETPLTSPTSVDDVHHLISEQTNSSPGVQISQQHSEPQSSISNNPAGPRKENSIKRSIRRFTKILTRPGSKKSSARQEQQDASQTTQTASPPQASSTSDRVVQPRDASGTQGLSP